jgi:chromosome segregation ATPase
MDQARADRLAQVRDFLAQLKAELQEFEDDLADHHSSMANLGDSKIDAQIRANLERLIEQAGPKMEKKRAKIAEVEAQLESLNRERRDREKPGRQKQARQEAATAAESTRQDGAAGSEDLAEYRPPQGSSAEPGDTPDAQTSDAAPEA